jgi:NTE family protein
LGPHRPTLGLSPRAQQTLFALPAFRGLAEADRRDAARLVHEIAVEKGETVYRAGDEADALYLVVSGAVDLVDGDKIVARVGPGEPFGESVLVAGERRLATARIALDATLLMLPRESVALLLELHPSLQERVSTLLFRRAKHAVHLALGAPRRRPSEVVVISGWSETAERRAFVAGLADALERELDLPAAIVTVASRARGPQVRPDRPDAVVSGDASREQLASELAARGAEAPIVLLTADDAPVPDLARFADVLLVRIDGRPPADCGGRPGHTIFVHDRRSGPGPSLSGNGVVSLPLDETGRRRHLARLARHLTHRSVGLALGSGAAWGLAHIGVLDVFEREGIPIDAIAGASMGAIVGAHYALGFAPTRLEEIATNVRTVAGIVRILPQLLYLAVDFNVTRPGLFAGEHFQRVLESLGPVKGRSFADLDVPFRAVATDITTGARVEVDDGDLSDAMRASFSAPWIFSPFRIGKHVLIDGGMSDPVPAETVRSMGADLVIGVNVVPPVYPHAQNPLEAALRVFAPINRISLGNSDRLPNSFDVVVRTLQIMQHELGNVRAGEADILISPDLRDHWVLEFWKAAEMIAQGRRAAEAQLPEIRRRIATLGGRVE